MVVQPNFAHRGIYNAFTWIENPTQTNNLYQPGSHGGFRIWDKESCSDFDLHTYCNMLAVPHRHI